MQATIEDCLALDANRLAKMGLFSHAGTRASVKWENGANIGLAYSNGTLELLYSMEGEPNNQTLRIAKVPCHFGGARYYMHCPGCRKRRYKLHLSGSGFYCRVCYRLPYYSQECGYLDGLIHQKHKVEAKLENRNRPRMRTYTQMRLISRLCELDDRIDRAMLLRFGPTAGRLLGK